MKYSSGPYFSLFWLVAEVIYHMRQSSALENESDLLYLWCVYLHCIRYGKLSGASEKPCLFYAVLKSSIRDGALDWSFWYDYYKISCPDVENTVTKAVLEVILTDPTAPAAFLRLLFHDCQVQVFLSLGRKLCSRLSSCLLYLTSLCDTGMWCIDPVGF